MMIDFDLEAEGVWEEVLRVAALRHKGKENRKSTRMYTSGNPNIIGCAGEMAFELATGIPMDRRQLEYGDEGWDFVLPDGTLVDVKTRSRTVGFRGDVTFFLKDKDLKKECDLFVLVLLDRTSDFTPLSTATIAGAIWQSDVLSIAEGQTKGYDLTWLIKLSRVPLFEDLFTLDRIGESYELKGDNDAS